MPKDYVRRAVVNYVIGAQGLSPFPLVFFPYQFVCLADELAEGWRNYYVGDESNVYLVHFLPDYPKVLRKLLMKGETLDWLFNR